jgi:hypothetical protein
MIKNISNEADINFLKNWGSKVITSKPKKNIEKVCKNPSCLGIFIPVNGTQNYCSSICYKEMKQERQKLLDDIIKDFRKGIYKNYKLFRDLLPKSGKCNIELEYAYKKGFDDHAYYGTSKDSIGREWHHIETFCFNIYLDSNGTKKLNVYRS